MAESRFGRKPVLVSFLSNYVLSSSFGLGWRWMLGVEAVPALLSLLMALIVPESPRWLLLHKRDEEESRQIFGIIDPAAVDRTIAEIRHAQREFTQGNLFDRAYRRTLMLIGSIGYIVSLAAVTAAFHMAAGGITVALFIFLFIASHALGQGAVIWVFIAEIFPNNVRTKGQSLGSGTHWVFAATITLLMPALLSRFDGATIFGFFTAMMVLQLAFVLFLMPETKGRSLEYLAEHLSRHEHPSIDDA